MIFGRGGGPASATVMFYQLFWFLLNLFFSDGDTGSVDDLFSSRREFLIVSTDYFVITLLLDSGSPVDGSSKRASETLRVFVVRSDSVTARPISEYSV